MTMQQNDLATVRPFVDLGLVPGTEGSQIRELVAIAGLSFSDADRQILRRLAGEVASLAARPIEEEKRELWRRHNALEPTRPVIFCAPENAWNEVFPPDRLECENLVARHWEGRLRREIFWGTKMGDDYTIQPSFDVPHVRGEPDWGLSETLTGGQDGGAYRWEAPIKSEEDVDSLRPPELAIDSEATDRMGALADEIFGDLLSVRKKTTLWSMPLLTYTLARLRGLEQMMYDMIDRPALIHRLMSLLRDGTQAMLDRLEASGLLSLNNDGSYVGRGGLGWSRELPAPGFDGRVRLCDLWGVAEAQDTVGISPRMYAEFVFPYEAPILERFGLNCYGCCEQLDKRWHVVERLPKLRRVSVSAWADVGKMAEMLGPRYVFAWKPTPADLAMDVMDEDAIRHKLREGMRLAREQDCRMEVIMKDNHTIRGDPQRLVRWVQIAREEAER
jgi:hypothetical protein